jgi:CheY-like chemotaxis protein
MPTVVGKRGKPDVRTVLVADDEFGILLVLEMALSDAGYRVITAGNGRQALELAAAEHPDLILMDWMMPIMDGPATAAALQADPALAKVPIVIMSGAPESSLRGRFNGYAAFLQKPFLDDQVLNVAKRVLKRDG